jgi:hypothetical protein
MNEKERLKQTLREAQAMIGRRESSPFIKKAVQALHAERTPTPHPTVEPVAKNPVIPQRSPTAQAAVERMITLQSILATLRRIENTLASESKKNAGQRQRERQSLDQLDDVLAHYR